ncbi:MAG: 4-hydroxyphenylacetate 3-hydroxylase N-terminal domain-containing protein, partial [Deltaproteobacteria bacterium]|nr:4-hydroxyphenylacetate 3-hydroxylase N-terminal domain-containing protein [Deltaproteobacteria bacterium]
MALITAEQYEESLKKRRPRIFMNGKKIEDVFENPNLRTVIEANKASYKWALDPKYQEIMTTISPLTNDRVNRYLYVCRSREDLTAKAIAGTFASERLGTCIYRCPGLDAFHSLASTTWEMDKNLGTEYHSRFTKYLKWVQENDLAVSGALTEPRGDRKKRAIDWPDPFLSLKVVGKKPDGIVVRGAKINISGAFVSHELVVLPQSAKKKEEGDYALAFAIPSDAEGLTYICQYSPYSA